jgi:branched-chain amino acid transport system permease protein
MCSGIGPRRAEAQEIEGELARPEMPCDGIAMRSSVAQPRPLRVNSAVERRATRRRLLLGGGMAALLLLMPLLLSPYALLVLSAALVFAIACLGLNLLLGHTGLVSFGHAAYFGVGAYTGGFLHAFSPVKSLEVYLGSGLVAATALAAIIGFLCVRATRMHFAMLTLAFAQMVHALFISGIIFRPFGGVGKGLFLMGGGGLYLPRFTIGGVEFAPTLFHTAFYYVIALAFVACLFLMWRIVHSPFGHALQAIRDNETRAAFIGLRIRRYRWCAFIISGAFVGLAGGLSGQLNRQVTPEQLHWLLSAKFVVATVLGGSRHFLGPVVGALAFVAVQELAGRVTLSYSLALGVMLIALVRVLPGGLVGGAVLIYHCAQTVRGHLPDQRHQE